MRLENRLFPLLGIPNGSQANLKKLSKSIDIPVERLKYYNEGNILPDEADMLAIEKHFNISRLEVMLGMGIMNNDLLTMLSSNHKQVFEILKSPKEGQKHQKPIKVYETKLGKLYEGDCVGLLSNLTPNSIDVIFADPPFNLDKKYESGINDSLTKEEYLGWCEKWLDGCIAALKYGGSMFIWNIPKWNTYLSDYLNRRMFFKHWISVDIKYSLPISGKLYPSHYSLLYYTKGEKANIFKPDRLPMEVCRHCNRELKDYGGYKNKMNPSGINLSDVWYDIPPVRHSKYKNRDANELSIKLLDRIIEMSSNPGDVVFDPFGGGGSTYVVAEMKQRKWIGVELGSTKHIVERFKNIEVEKKQLKSIRKNLNVLFTAEVKAKRQQSNIWTDETYHEK